MVAIAIAEQKHQEEKTSRRRRRENNKIVEEGIITLRWQNNKIEGKY